jgi:hypothetical protein
MAYLQVHEDPHPIPTTDPNSAANIARGTRRVGPSASQFVRCACHDLLIAKPIRHASKMNGYQQQHVPDNVNTV